MGGGGLRRGRGKGEENGREKSGRVERRERR
jgi:hypothetical protein